MPRTRPARLLLRVALVLVGAGVSLGGLVVYRHAWRLGWLVLPWGMALALATTYVCVAAAVLIDRPRPAALCFGGGWVIVFLAVMAGRPEGDYLVSADLLGYGYLSLGILAVGVPVGRAFVAPEAGRRDGDDRTDRRLAT